ncbi:MAG: VWA domain-containing protein [Chlamydiales bacterium]|nr:VWA domain-containing protein [Chlamydiales bacterium]
MGGQWSYSITGFIIAVVVFVAIPLLYFYRKRQKAPFLYYSQLSDLPSAPILNWRLQLTRLPEYLLMLAIGFFAVALIDIRIQLPPKPPKSSTGLRPKPAKTPTVGAALYFVLDVSGSMARKVPYTGSGDLPTFPSKIELMKLLTERFLEGDEALNLPGRPTDLIGLVTFARKADIIAPLTLDHEAVIAKLRDLQTVASQEEDGTGIGYAIYKTASTIAATRHYGEQLPKKQKPAYDILSSSIILITDGFQSPNASDKGNWLRTMGMEEAAEYAKKQNIKVYIINIEPSLAQAEFQPHRNLLTRVAESTGGKFFLVDTQDSLPEIYREIDALEKTVLPFQGVITNKMGQVMYAPREYSFLPIFVALGLLCLAAAIGIETTIRVVP